MRESTTEHSGLIRGTCVSQIPEKAVMTSCEECRYPWRWDISENVLTHFHGFSHILRHFLNRNTFSPSISPANLPAQPFPQPGTNWWCLFWRVVHLPSPLQTEPCSLSLCWWQDMGKASPRGCLTPPGRFVLLDGHSCCGSELAAIQLAQSNGRKSPHCFSWAFIVLFEDLQELH